MVFGADKATISISACASAAHSFTYMYIYMWVYIYVNCVYACACVSTSLCVPFYSFLLNKALLICRCKKCLQHCVCMSCMHAPVSCVVCVCVCGCVCARAIHTGWWWIPTTLRAYFSRRTRERERKTEKRREPGHRESKHVYCLSYPIPTTARVQRVQKITEFFSKEIHAVDSLDVKMIFSRNPNIYMYWQFWKMLFNIWKIGRLFSSKTQFAVSSVHKLIVGTILYSDIRYERWNGTVQRGQEKEGVSVG